MKNALPTNIVKELISAAISARENAYAPYSAFKVGAALLSNSGEVFTGCNVENAAYGPTNCAERTAFFKAVCAGQKEFAAIAIVGAKEGSALEFCPPCGICRQVMAEFCNGDFLIITATSPDEFMVYTLDEMLPHRFGKDTLNQ